MNRLEYHFDCLDGKYLCVCQFDDESLSYVIKSSIPELSGKSGELSKEEAVRFNKLLEEAQIEKWDREYMADLSGIADAVKWKVKLIKDDKEYVSRGEESFEPYTYKQLIDALRLMEGKADYFLAQGDR
ncbi:MAG: hypothetical protein II678_03990 [Erysipelotrichaceae bacterium]|nr:hypothetical protein [Erysipelotrichaceae bacterium]